MRLTNAAILEVPFEDYCTVKDKIQNYVQCESCKVRIYLFVIHIHKYLLYILSLRNIALLQLKLLISV